MPRMIIGTAARPNGTVVDLCSECWPPSPKMLIKTFEQRFTYPVSEQEALEVLDYIQDGGWPHKDYGSLRVPFRCDYCREPLTAHDN